MVCDTCYSFTGVKADHTVEICPLNASFLCRRCHCRGHLASQCGESWAHWERPTSLEELIPADVRERWGIQTSTQMVFETERGTSDREFRMEIRVPNNDKKMRAFMSENQIKTTHKKEDNLQSVRDWALQRGLRVRLMYD